MKTIFTMAVSCIVTYTVATTGSSVGESILVGLAIVGLSELINIRLILESRK